MGPAVFLLLCVCVLAFNVLRFFRVIGFPSSYVLMPYQSGFLYRRGRPIRAAGPGRHRLFAGSEKILFLDMRPIQFSSQERVVALADGTTAVYSFNISAKVKDVRKATYASPNYTQFPAWVAVGAARSVLNTRPSSAIAKGHKALEQEIGATCGKRLAEAGFELVSFQLTSFEAMGSGSSDDEDE
jgi:SPFH domain / Band 7 family